MSQPPVRTVHATFTAHGSRERDVDRKLPFRQLHGTFTVVSLRVRWLPLYHFPTLSLRAFAMYVALLGRHRARCLTVRLPIPPVRPVRETFASYGSRQRDIMGKVLFASSTVHSPWTALRVRWVPVYCFPTLSLRPFAMYVAFLRSGLPTFLHCACTAHPDLVIARWHDQKICTDCMAHHALPQPSITSWQRASSA